MKEVLIVSDKSIITKSIIKYLEERGDSVMHTDKGVEALQALFLGKIDVLVTSVFLEDVDGVQLITTLRNSQVVNSNATTILLTSGGDPSELFSENACPDIILKKDEKVIDNFIEFYEGLGKTDSVSIDLLYIDDDPFIQKIIKTWFKKVPEVNLTMCGSIAELKGLLGNTYDIIVSDNLLDDGNITDVLGQMKDTPLADTPLLVYTGTVDKLKLNELQEIGNVLDILPKPFELKSFMKKVEAIKKMKG